MGPICADIVIDQPRERVFDFVSDLANRDSFCDHFIEDLRLERIESDGVGAAARFRVSPPLTTMWMETVVEEAQRPHRLSERGRGGRLDRIPAHTVWELHAEPGGSTELRVSFWTEPSSLLDRARELCGASRWYRRQWGRALGRLREVLESGVAVERTGVAGEDRIPAAAG